MDIAELKSKSIAELHEMAEELNISNYSGLRKQDLIFRIEQNLLDSDVVLRGEGVLEFNDDGAVVQVAEVGPQTAQGERGMGKAGVKR